MIDITFTKLAMPAHGHWGRDSSGHGGDTATLRHEGLLPLLGNVFRAPFNFRSGSLYCAV